MKESDPLKSILHEWEAPAPPSSLDTTVRARYRSLHPPSVWRRMWTARVTVPVPVIAGLLLIIGLWMQFWPRLATAPAGPEPPTSPAYITRIDSVGFQPLPDGEIRIIRSGERRP